MAKQEALQKRYDFWTVKIQKAEDDKARKGFEANRDKVVAEAVEAGIELVETEVVAAETVAGPAPSTPAASAKGKAAKGTAAGAAKVAERAAKLAEAKAAGPAAGATKAKKEKKLRPCLDGCGTMVPGNFKMGHDAKLKSLILKIERGEEAQESIPEVALDLVKFKRGEKQIETKRVDGKDVKTGETQLYICTAAPVKFPGRDDMTLTKRSD